MLPKEKGGVVGSNLKVGGWLGIRAVNADQRTTQVYGTSNIRVVDLSIIPLHFAAHTLCKESLPRASMI